jgi:hypothetical protein
MDQATLHGFAYGEHLEGPQRRSLGYRLLAPAEPEPWCAEVEALARGLHAAPYPDPWPPTELFCSVLLSDGQRVVAIARYGLADHTASQRRGGLELIGVVAPGGLGVSSALAIAQWLRQRRAETDDPSRLGGQFALADLLTAVPPALPPREAVPVLPIRLWQEGAWLFAATAPSDPDHRLGLLEEGASGTWQWLPFVGPDFPLQSYAQRGPVVAWTPHLAGVAVKLDRKPTEVPRPASARGRGVLAALIVGAIVLMAANLWALLDLPRRINVDRPIVRTTESPPPMPSIKELPAEDSRERFAQALYRQLQKQGDLRDWNQSQLIDQYERMATQDEALRLNRPDGKMAVGAVSLLARRSPKQIETLVREGLANRGFDPRLIDLACQRVHERLVEDARETP